MKKKYILLICLLFHASVMIFAQSPLGMNYQAIARDSTGVPLINQDVSIRISILTGGPSGNPEYTETHALQTNDLGLFALIIGEGITQDDFSAIDWSAGGEKWLQVEMDGTGGTNYILMGSSRMMSVPYALWAQNASNGSSQWNSAGNNIYYSQGGIAVGSTAPDNSAIADFTSHNKGMLIPRLTEAQRDSIFNPSQGLLIFNTSTNCLNVFKVQGWWELCGTCLMPPAPVPSSNTPACEGDTLKLFVNTVAGATYAWIGPNGFSSGVQNPVITDITLSDSGDYQVFISNCCGVSGPGTTHVSIKHQPTQADAGPDQTAVNGTSTNLEGNTPVFGNGFWTIVSGTGGVLTNPSLPTTLFSGNIDSTYSIEWSISNNCGTSRDTVVIHFGSTFTCGDSLYDPRDGKSYSTVQIGSQCWMGENLDIGTQIQGTVTPTNNGVIEKYCYNDSPGNCDAYGGLYTWYEAMEYDTTQSIQGICPPGWIIPSDQEWIDMEMALGMSSSQAYLVNAWRGTNQGTQLKYGGSSGFDALLAGRVGYGVYSLLNLYEYTWTSSQYGTTYAWRRCLQQSDSRVGRWNTFPKGYGFSIRCIKN